VLPLQAGGEQAEADRAAPHLPVGWRRVRAQKRRDVSGCRRRRERQEEDGQSDGWKSLHGSIVVQFRLSPVKSHHYSQHAAALRTELGRAVPRGMLMALHKKDAARHLLVAARQFAILALSTWGLISFESPLIWIPLAIVQGFTVFNFTVLLHEVVHHTVFEGSRPRAERLLAWLYAVPSGISASQFTRWHL